MCKISARCNGFATVLNGPSIHVNDLEYGPFCTNDGFHGPQHSQVLLLKLAHLPHANSEKPNSTAHPAAFQKLLVRSQERRLPRRRAGCAPIVRRRLLLEVRVSVPSFPLPFSVTPCPSGPVLPRRGKNPPPTVGCQSVDLTRLSALTCRELGVTSASRRSSSPRS